MPDIVHRLRTSIILLDAEREEAATEIERLRKDVVHWREARRMCIAAGDMMKEEIEQLRGLLQQGINVQGLFDFQAWKQRVREVLEKKNG